MSRKLVVLFAFVACVTACTHRVNLALRPTFDNALRSEGLAAITPPLTVRPGDVVDKRADTTKVAMFKQGIHTYNVYAERPPADVIVEGLQSLFSRAGHTWTDVADARITVDIQLLGIETARNAGFVKVGAISTVQIRLDFMATSSGTAIYSEVYNGTDERDRALVGLMGMVKDSVDQAIINCLDSVGKDARLAAALRVAAGQ